MARLGPRLLPILEGWSLSLRRKVGTLAPHLVGDSIYLDLPFLQIEQMALKTSNLMSEEMVEENAEGQPPETRWYNNMKTVVWIVVAEINDGTDKRIGTGFCVHKDGYILTSAYRIRGAHKVSICNKADRRLIAAEPISYDVASGIAVLKVNQNCDYALIGHDTGLNQGKDVFTISHSTDLYFTFFVGKLVSGLKGKNEIGLELTELQRFIKNLRKDIRLVQIYGFLSKCHKEEDLQSLGAPIFDTSGSVIGMIIASDRGHEYAVTATHLRRIFETTQRGEGSSGQVIRHKKLKAN